MARSQNKGLSEHQRRPSRLRTGPSPRWRERRAGDSQSRKARGNLDPRDASSTKLWAGPQWRTKASEILDSWHPPGGSQPETSSPEDTHGAAEMALHGTPRNPRGWPGRWTGAPPGCRSVCATDLVSWAAQTWRGHETQAQSLCLGAVPGNLTWEVRAEQPGAWA